MYRLLRALPYFLLIFLACLFLWISKDTSDPTSQAIAINLASSAFFIVTAYFFYDLARAYVEKKESQYITEYIGRHVMHDVCVVLHLVKKYIHGYDLETNTLSNILAVSAYPREKIRSSIGERKYVGFSILKDLADLKGMFKAVTNNSLVVRYAQKEQIISLLKIVSLLSAIINIFKDENNFIISEQDDADFLIIDGKEMQPKNEEIFLLVKKTGEPDKFIVYDYGIFEQQNFGKLLRRYELKKEAINVLTEKIFKLNQYLGEWLPKHQGAMDPSGKFRINSDKFSMFTGAFSNKNRIYVSDVILAKANEFT